MDGINLQQIRDVLLERQNRLDIGGLASGARTEIDPHQAEIGDIAQALEQIDREKSLAEQERRELIAIERALSKLASGSFGYCEDCEEEIPHRRLLAVPQARLCAKCQEIEERMQHRIARVTTPAFLYK